MYKKEKCNSISCLPRFRFSKAKLSDRIFSKGRGKKQKFFFFTNVSVSVERLVSCKPRENEVLCKATFIASRKVRRPSVEFRTNLAWPIAIEIAGRRASDEYRFHPVCIQLWREEVEEFLKIKFLAVLNFYTRFPPPFTRRGTVDISKSLFASRQIIQIGSFVRFIFKKSLAIERNVIVLYIIIYTVLRRMQRVNPLWISQPG